MSRNWQLSRKSFCPLLMQFIRVLSFYGIGRLWMKWKEFASNLPLGSNFPASSEEEWLQYRWIIVITLSILSSSCNIPLPGLRLNRGFGLRSAHAYILVYDVTSPKVKLFGKMWTICAIPFQPYLKWQCYLPSEMYFQSFMFLQFLREQIAISRGLSEVTLLKFYSLDLHILI